MNGSVMWTCEYRECDKTYKRWNSDLKRGVKKYCCQSHAALEQWLNDRIRITGKRKLTDFICAGCHQKGTAGTSLKKYCKECYRINGNINTLKRVNPNLQNFTVLDYYNLLKQQNNKCAICKINKCKTGKRFAIDHNHKTGQIRGLICYSCNHKLGWYEHQQSNIDKYLTQISN